MSNRTSKNINYLNKDFDQFKESLQEFTKTYFPNTYNDFTESTPGQVFLEQSAYVGDVLSYYTDRQLKESLLEYATYKPDVLALAYNNSYKPNNIVPAIVTLDVYIQLPAINNNGVFSPNYSFAPTINEGMICNAENSSQQFRTTELVNFGVSTSDNPIEVSVYSVNELTKEPLYYLLRKKVNAIAGEIRTKSFTFESAKQFDKILLEDDNIINVISIVDSENNKWYEVPFLAQDIINESVPNTNENTTHEFYQYNDTVPYLLKQKRITRRYTTKFRADNNLEIQFGSGISTDEDAIVCMDTTNVKSRDGYTIDSGNFLVTDTYGLAPANTTLTVTYSVGGGVKSNVASNTITTIGQISFTQDTDGLDASVINYVQSSVAVNNPQPASGGSNTMTVDEIRQNAIANFAAQNRIITKDDYIARVFSMPAIYGSVAKAYIIKDDQIDTISEQRIENPLALNMYLLGYDANGHLTTLNNAIKQNLQTYLSNYRMITDAVNIKDAYIINIGLTFDIITKPQYNSNTVLLKCMKKIQDIFDVSKWQINEPIILSNIYTELDTVDGVQTVVNITINNLYSTNDGYSGNFYDIDTATKNGVIYPSLDPSIFEIKYPNKDIIGRVTTL